MLMTTGQDGHAINGLLTLKRELAYTSICRQIINDSNKQYSCASNGSNMHM